MKELTINGIIPPVMTPFQSDGQPDLEAYSRLIDFLVAHVQGLYPLGTYGSGPLMPKDMRIGLAEFVVRKVDGRVPVIMHIGAADTDTAVELAQAARKAGANAVASIVPFYYKHDERCLNEHFTRILDAVDIPFYVYNNPGMGNNAITPALLADLADKGLKGIKDSSFDILTFYAFKRAVSKPDFHFIIGTEALLVAAVTAGATACVSGVANTFPELMVELWNAAQAGEYEKSHGAPAESKPYPGNNAFEQLRHLHARHARPARHRCRIPTPPPVAGRPGPGSRNQKQAGGIGPDLNAFPENSKHITTRAGKGRSRS